MTDPRLHLSAENLVDELRESLALAVREGLLLHRRAMAAEAALAAEKAAHAETREWWAEQNADLHATIATQAEELTRYREALEEITTYRNTVASDIAAAALETPDATP